MKTLYCRALLICLFAVNASCATSRVDDLIQKARDAYVDCVDCYFTDILGSLRSVTIPLNAAKRVLEHGTDFDGSSIPGYSSIYESDMHLQPDLNTFQIVDGTARVICDVHENAHEPYQADPRSILKKQLARARELGYEFYVGPELEFFILNEGSTTPVDKDRYFDASSNTYIDNQKKGLLNTLVRNGIAVEKLHHEVASGQYEMSIHYGNALEIADQIVLAKHIVERQADSFGLRATFMPKPFTNMNGSGMHVHFSLYNTTNQCNAFYDNHDSVNLSAVARHFIAGILKYIPEMSAICNPTINSYKRLVIGYEAPVYICWATKNRSALIRIPQIDACESSAARAEIRSPDATSNPYVLFAGLLAAGLAGLEEAHHLQVPIEKNLYKLSQEQVRELDIMILPENLTQALSCLRESDFAHRALGYRFVEEFLSLKEKEVLNFNRSITDWEWQRYA